MKRSHVINLGTLVAISLTPALLASDLTLEAESGTVWFSRNDVRIPGDSGTRFDLLDLTGEGPDPYIRLNGTYAFNERHALRLTIAPLEVSGTGTLDEDTVFKDAVFAADVPTTGTYRFNTYRLTYRWNFHDSERWRWGVGPTLLVRDAEITLVQNGMRQSRDDLGLVPLLHVHGVYRWSPRIMLVLDVEGAAGGPGRAIDAALKAHYQFDSDWHASLGYRTLEGGADTDDVYTFAWLHYALAEVGYRF